MVGSTQQPVIRSKSDDAPLSSKPCKASHLTSSTDDTLTVGFPASPRSHFLPSPDSAPATLAPGYPSNPQASSRPSPQPGCALPRYQCAWLSHLLQAFAPTMSFLIASWPSPSELWSTSFSHSTYHFQQTMHLTGLSALLFSGLFLPPEYQLCVYFVSRCTPSSQNVHMLKKGLNEQRSACHCLPPPQLPVSWGLRL